jgi:hypothetical protein
MFMFLLWVSSSSCIFSFATYQRFQFYIQTSSKGEAEREFKIETLMKKKTDKMMAVGSKGFRINSGGAY